MKKTIRLNERDLHRMIKESVKNILNEGIHDNAEQEADKIADFIGYEQAFHALANLVCMDDPNKLLEYVQKIKEMYYANGVI